MYLVKVDDGFVEWAFELEGSDEYSIQNLVDVICKNTNLHVVKSAQPTLAPDGAKASATLNSLYNCYVYGEEKCISDFSKACAICNNPTEGGRVICLSCANVQRSKYV